MRARGVLVLLLGAVLVGAPAAWGQAADPAGDGGVVTDATVGAGVEREASAPRAAGVVIDATVGAGVERETREAAAGAGLDAGAAREAAASAGLDAGAAREAAASAGRDAGAAREAAARTAREAEVDASVARDAPPEPPDAGTSTTADAPAPPRTPLEEIDALIPSATTTPPLVVPAPALPGSTPVALPSTALDDDTRALWRIAQRLVPVLQDEEPGSGWLLLAAALFLLGVALALARLRGALPARGALPRLTRWVQAGVGAALALLLLALIPRLLPAAFAPLLPWVLVAAAVSLGWSSRELLADGIAGVVLLGEGRIGRGTWIRCEDHHGQIERRTLRALWLRDARGRAIAVPYRRVLRSPVIIEADPTRRHEVSVRLAAAAPGARVRQALTDAALASPWVRPGARPEVRRDPLDPTLWHVTVALVDASAASAFEADVLARVERDIAD